MNEREKISHLLRRFGLGAGKYEVDQYAPLGVEGTIDRLINYEKVDEKFPVNPYEMTGYGEEGLLMLDPPRFAAWWSLRLLLTQRPLQERLTLFWHNHFAVSGDKVFYGPSVLEYQQVLRRNASGNFRTLLHEVSKTPAMVFYLDAQMSVKGKPNENVAREVMELFTLGAGHYTEKDIQEAARAFTGWGIHYVDFGGQTPFEQIIDRCAREEKMALNFCDVPALHDSGEKTILSKTAKFSGDDVLDHLCAQARCPEFISHKLAKWFIEPPISDGLKTKLAKVMSESNLEIKPMLKVIAASDEFWSDANVLKRHRSPIDYYVAWFRQLGIQPVLLGLRGEVPNPYKPMKQELRGAAEGLLFLMSREGFLLHFPPNVSGWNWGEAWITTANMTARQTFPTMILRGDDTNRPISSMIAAKLINENRVTNEMEIVKHIVEIFDAHIPDAKLPILAEAVKKLGGVEALKDKEKASILLASLSGLMVATPEYQLC